MLTNLGHLPGTFSTEKGLTQWLFEESPESPTALLPWPEHQERDGIISHANEYLTNADYAGLNRILSLIRVLGLLDKATANDHEWMHGLLHDFYIPFLFSIRRAPERVELWEKIDTNYQSVRHVSYLNIDAAFADVPVRVDVTSLLRGLPEPRHSEPENAGGARQRSVERIEHAREVLGAYEHSVFEGLYHSEPARKCAGIVAHLVRENLRLASDPKKTIMNWLAAASIDAVIERQALSAAMDEFNTIASVSLRTHFLYIPPPQKILADQEDELARSLDSVTSLRGRALANILHYIPWEREQHIEPPHVYVDFFTTDRPRSNQIGRIILELARTLDETDLGPLARADDFYLLEKVDLGFVYSQLLSAAFSLSLHGRRVTLKPWPISALRQSLSGFGDTPMWLADRNLSDEHIRSLLRRGEWTGPQNLRSQWAELLGLADLREQLRKEDRNKHGDSLPRQKYLVLTASIQVFSGSEVEAEFDGGIIRIGSRKGHMTFFGLETKSRSSSGRAQNVLLSRLNRLDISDAQVCLLGKGSAYCEIPLDI
jgi:hypothetical protein